jgi:hypothetical protein
MKRRIVLALGASATAAVLAGCASMNQLAADVSTFGEWPAGRTPGTYAFERLPSQQVDAQAQTQLEEAARPALERAGFRPAPAGTQPDVLVQVGARLTRSGPSPWDDPLWWHGGFGYWRGRPWGGPWWGASLRYDSPRYDREVALLIRDRSSGKPLYEAHASSEGYGGFGSLLGPLYVAALLDFPAVGISPRRVTVSLAS